jgi:hypothetical protein
VVQQQLLDSLPPGLRALSWGFPGGDGPQQLSFDSLTGLTSLHLQDSIRQVGSSELKENTFTALCRLRKLHLCDVPISDAGLLACKEQLVTLRPRGMTRVLGQLTNLQGLDVARCDAQVATQLLQQAPDVRALAVRLTDMHLRLPTATQVFCSWEVPGELQHYRGLTALRGLTLTVDAAQAAPIDMCLCTQLRQLSLSLGHQHKAHVATWVYSVAGLVNLEVLSVPVDFIASSRPWLTQLTRLVVLEVQTRTDLEDPMGLLPRAGGCLDVNAAGLHLGQVLTHNTRSPRYAAANPIGSSSSSSAGGLKPLDRVMVVCVKSGTGWAAAALLRHQAVLAAVRVLPPGVHLFNGSLNELRTNGVELWPAPVAARLRQLWPVE